MKPRCLLIGAGSFIARHWLATTKLEVIPVGRDGDPSCAAAGCTVIVNCATDPRIREGAYREAYDLDLAAARLASTIGAHFVMLSTRKVYRGTRQTAVLDESSVLDPGDGYGRNKLESERRIGALLGERCTVLRIGNVFGQELGRRSFFGLAMSRLVAEQRIVLDVSPFTERDFIPVEQLTPILDAVCTSRPSGIFNLGSGKALPLGRIAQWLIQGYQCGRLEIIDVAERDGFVINPEKLLRTLQIKMPPFDAPIHITQLGRSLPS